MKNNTAILNCDTQEIEIIFEGAEISFDLNDGDIEDYWNSFGIEMNIYDINFSLYGGNPFVSVYRVQNGKRSDVGLSLEIVEIIGSIEALSDYDNEDESETVSEELLEHEVLNQIEADINDNDYESVSEMLQKLMESPISKEILYQYLSDSAQKNVKEGLTKKRY
jgi:hypothetical protein